MALKLSHVNIGRRELQAEVDAYKLLAGGVGIPRFCWYGDECEYYVLAHELLGPSLEDLFNYCGRKFSLKTALLIADQAISRIAYFHAKGILHRDIKPENFLMGTGKQGIVLYTVDFGMAVEFLECRWRTDATGIPLRGTLRYASINNHIGRSKSRL